MRLPRWSDEPVDLIPVMIFFISKRIYVLNIRKKEEKAIITLMSYFAL